MNDDLLTSLSDKTPPANDAAKQRAIHLAMAEFHTVQREQAAQHAITAHKKISFFQGLFHWFRPIGNNNPNRNEQMDIANKKLFFSGMATCGIAVIGIVFFYNAHNPVTDVINRSVVSEQTLQELAKNSPQAAVATPSDDVIAEKNSAIEHVDESLPDMDIAQALQQAPDVRREAAAHAAQQALSAKADTEEKSAVAARQLHVPANAAPVAIMSDMPSQPAKEYRDRFPAFKENSVQLASEHPVSTFSVDVDTASYSVVRSRLNGGHLPPKSAVRTEEMINYFDYHYAAPKNKTIPFQPTIAVMDSPWKAGNKLIHIGIKGYELPAAQIPRSNLVFLLDVSGSMNSPDKLPLVQQSMELLLSTLKPDDTIAIAVYAGAAGTVLAPTKVKEKQKILEAIQKLQAGGATAGAEGIQLAYQLAQENFDKRAVNRIILATDGDFNVGPMSDADLKTLVERKREQGIYLSVLGFGQGNYQDAMMQTLAQNGNGVAAYIDTLSEAQKVLVDEATSMLFTIATDVKIQVEFNPATVAEYRLIGYETRALNREDFNNDKVDAGDIGAGHTVTAIYEITPAGEGNPLLDNGRYAAKANQSTKSINTNDEYAFLRIRYKLPGEAHQN